MTNEERDIINQFIARVGGATRYLGLRERIGARDAGPSFAAGGPGG